MFPLATGIIAVLCAVAVYRTAAWISTARWIRGTTVPEEVHTDGPRLVLLIPCLREQTLVQETVNFFQRFRYHLDHLAIVFVTTAKEDADRQRQRSLVATFARDIAGAGSLGAIERRNCGLFPRSMLPDLHDLIQKLSTAEAVQRITELYDEMPTTADLLQKEIPGEWTHVHQIHYPFVSGGKAAQLNHALASLGQLGLDGEPSRTYVGVYDFDARPDFRTGLYIAGVFLERARDGRAAPAMFQQTQVPLLRLEALRELGLPWSFLLRGNAIRYLRRALGIELFRIRLGRWVQRRRLWWLAAAIIRPVVYGVGSGLFVRLDKIRATGGFPEPQEDLGVGYRLTMLGEEIAPIPLLNVMEPFSSYRQMWSSFSHIFLSSWSIEKERLHVQRLPGSSRLSDLECRALVLREWLDCLLWCTGVPLVIAAYVLLYFSHAPIELAVLLTLAPLCVRCLLDLALLDRTAAVLLAGYRGADVLAGATRSTALLTVLSAPVQPLMDLGGPLIALTKTGLAKLRNERVERTKTER